MDIQTETTRSQQPTIWQIVMLFLCTYVLIALFLDSAFRLPQETSKLLGRSDKLVCIVFIGDFAFNLAKAKSKLGY